MRFYKSVREGLLYVAMLVGRCATATNRREEHEARFESPRAALVCVLSALLLSVSCASALTGVTENISVDSTPQGADVTLFCGVNRVGDAVTPAKFAIVRNAGDCVVQVSKSGYADQRATIEQGVNPAYWGNFLTSPVALVGVYVLSGATAGIGASMILVGTSGWFVDLRTGAIHAHRPGHVRLTLHRSESE
jgi:hypothetical protein